MVFYPGQVVWWHRSLGMVEQVWKPGQALVQLFSGGYVLTYPQQLGPAFPGVEWVLALPDEGC